MGLEYLFFDASLRDRFMRFAADRGLPCATREDGVEGFVVELPEDLDDELEDALEEAYESLMDEQMALAEADSALVSKRVAGVTVALPDGRSRVVRLPAPVARRLLEHFTPEEVHEIVTAIAVSLENPIDGPLCRSNPDTPNAA